MSNLSDIGFPTPDEQAVNEMIMHVLEFTVPVECPQGLYLKFSDASGAEIYLQGNFNQELVGFNPHFAGTSRRTVGITRKIERDSSELDGGFHAWANPADSSDTETSGEYPFVFDAPDFRVVKMDKFPIVKDIQLTAFASNDFRIFASEDAYYGSQESETKFAAKSFIPSGLFSFGENDDVDLSTVRPIAVFAGEIKKFELLTNQLSGQEFYWFLVETLGGEADVVADPKLVSEEPRIGGIVSGQFWLTGKIYE